MIYRVQVQGMDTGRLRGCMAASPANRAMAGLPCPDRPPRRARFWFTEAGWTRFGRRVCTALRREGRWFRVLRTKNPAPSRVAWQDRDQVALLPG